MRSSRVASLNLFVIMNISLRLRSLEKLEDITLKIQHNDIRHRTQVPVTLNPTCEG